MNAYLQVTDLVCSYRGSRGIFRASAATPAVRGVSFSVGKGTTFGLVGESGSGKSTVARAVCRLGPADSGSVMIDGVDMLRLKGSALRPFRRTVQLVLQDPYGALDPRWRVGDLISEGLRVHRLLARDLMPARVAELLSLCGLPPEIQHRYPHEFSGGQRQRICIARALAVEPALLVLDEPVSALDVSVRAQILSLLQDLQAQLDLTFVFIGHDLAVVSQFCDHAAVMHRGQIVEQGEVLGLLTKPEHPYTQTLLEAVPKPPGLNSSV